MSIIYDALQKTQRSREYLKLQTAITPQEPHRRNLKWMALGTLSVIIASGLGGFITIYLPSFKLVLKSPAPAVSRTLVKPSAEKSVEALVPASTHPWVTDSTPRSQVKTSMPVSKEATETRVLAQTGTVAKEANHSAQSAAFMQQEISTALNHGKIILNGVMISGSERVVLINNQAFHVGDVVDGMKIVSIEFNNIKMLKDQKLVEMKVPV